MLQPRFQGNHTFVNLIESIQICMLASVFAFMFPIQGTSWRLHAPCMSQHQLQIFVSKLITYSQLHITPRSWGNLVSQLQVACCGSQGQLDRSQSQWLLLYLAQESLQHRQPP